MTEPALSQAFGILRYDSSKVLRSRYIN